MARIANGLSEGVLPQFANMASHVMFALKCNAAPDWRPWSQE
jgi:hypothetical protein